MSGDLNSKIYKILSEAGDEEARLDSDILAEEFSGSEHAALLAAQTRASGVPLAYVTGNKYFWRQKYDVSVGVLIPRSDTEILVEAALKFCGCNDMATGDVASVPSDCSSSSVLFADLCTGSGCVGLSLASELVSCGRSVDLKLVDFSSVALEYAGINAGKYFPAAEIVSFDVLSGEALPWQGLDFITANPPYIDDADYAALSEGVRFYEPAEALKGGADGLSFYPCLCALGRTALRSGGMLLVEHGYNRGAAVREIFERAGYTSCVTLRDYGGNERVTCGRFYAG